MRLQLLLAMLLGLMMLAPDRAQAQTACPPGMEAYGAGVCGYSQSQPTQQGPALAPPRRHPPISFGRPRYGAFAIDRKMQVSASWSNPSAEGAMTSAYDACVKANGGGCHVVSGQAFQHCGGVSADGAGLVYMVTDPRCVVIAKTAMEMCKSQSKVGECHMLTGIIDAGTDDINPDSFDRKQMSLTDDQLTALSR